MSGLFASLAGGGLMTLLLSAGFGFGFAMVAGQGRKRSAMIGALCAVALGVALSASPVFRSNMAGSLTVLFVLSLVAIPIGFYAFIIRRIRRRSMVEQKPEPGLRLIENDAVLFADRLELLKQENAQQPGFWRDSFSVAYRDEAGGFVGSVRVVIVLGLAELHALHVDEGARGTGIGAALLSAAEEEAARRGATRGMLHTFSWQVPGFYAHHGWQEIRRIPLDTGAERIEFEKVL